MGAPHQKPSVTSAATADFCRRVGSHVDAAARLLAGAFSPPRFDVGKMVSRWLSGYSSGGLEIGLGLRSVPLWQALILYQIARVSNGLAPRTSCHRRLCWHRVLAHFDAKVSVFRNQSKYIPNGIALELWDGYWSGSDVTRSSLKAHQSYSLQPQQRMLCTRGNGGSCLQEPAPNATDLTPKNFLQLSMVVSDPIHNIRRTLP